MEEGPVLAQVVPETWVEAEVEVAAKVAVAVAVQAMVA